MPELNQKKGNMDYLKSIDELLDLTKKAHYYVEKKDLSKVYMITDRRKKLLSKLKFKSAPSEKSDITRAQLENIQELDASIKTMIEAELSELLKKVCLIKKELKFRESFIGASKISRKIINGKV